VDTLPVLVPEDAKMRQVKRRRGSAADVRNPHPVIDIDAEEKARHQQAQVLAAGLGFDTGGPLPSGCTRWLVDTGSGYDLIGRQELTDDDEQYLLRSEPIEFFTANGSTTSMFEYQMVLDNLDEQLEVRVLDNTPAVLSVGRRCMEDGYTFVWHPGKLPYFVLPSGKRVPLEVEGYVPYLRSGPQTACPVTFGPGLAARTAPLVQTARPPGSSTDPPPEPAPVPDAGGDAPPEPHPEAAEPEDGPGGPVIPADTLRQEAVSVRHSSLTSRRTPTAPLANGPRSRPRLPVGSTTAWSVPTLRSDMATKSASTTSSSVAVVIRTWIGPGGLAKTAPPHW
jgi:hypothetical protein